MCKELVLVMSTAGAECREKAPHSEKTTVRHPWVFFKTCRIRRTPARLADAPPASSGFPESRASCSAGSCASRSTVDQWEIALAAHTSARSPENARPVAKACGTATGRRRPLFVARTLLCCGSQHGAEVITFAAHAAAPRSVAWQVNFLAHGGLMCSMPRDMTERKVI